MLGPPLPLQTYMRAIHGQKYRPLKPDSQVQYEYKLVFGSSVNIRRWTRYCLGVMAHNLFSTGRGTFRRAERKEACNRWFGSEVLR